MGLYDQARLQPAAALEKQPHKQQQDQNQQQAKSQHCAMCKTIDQGSVHTNSLLYADRSRTGSGVHG